MANINEYLEQQESYLNAKKSCELIIDLMNYKIDDDLLIDDQENKVWAESLISKINFEDFSFNIVLDYPCDVLYEEGNFEREEDYLSFSYDKGDSILRAQLDVQDIKEQVKYTERLLGGKSLFKDTNHLFSKVYKVFGPISDMDLVHMEVLLSQVLRSKKDPGLPARVHEPFDPVTMNIKEIPFKSSYLSGLLFENINKALSQGLIQEEDIPPSILERLFTGDLT